MSETTWDVNAHNVKMRDAYANLTAYWLGHRVVTKWQTVEFIADQAAHCSRLLAHYSTLVR